MLDFKYVQITKEIIFEMVFYQREGHLNRWETVVKQSQRIIMLSNYHPSITGDPHGSGRQNKSEEADVNGKSKESRKPSKFSSIRY